MRLCRMICAAALVLAPVSAMSGTNGEEDAIVINRISETEFEVIEGMNFGAASFWCGAATYIERRMGQSELTAIYVKRPEAESLTVQGRDGVVFTTSNDGLPPAQDRLTLTVDVPGAMLKSAQARRHCRDAFTRSTK